jgi:predicted neuraminidase
MTAERDTRPGHGQPGDGRTGDGRKAPRGRKAQGGRAGLASPGARGILLAALAACAAATAAPAPTLLATHRADALDQTAASSAAGPTSGVIFTGNRGHVHASSIVETPSGALLAAWYENADPDGAGPFEGQDRDKREDVRISGARRAPGREAWSTPYTLADTPGAPDNNPALAIDRDGRLWLVHATLLGVPDLAWGSALTRALVSSDYDRDATPRWDASHTILPRPPGLFETVAAAAAQMRLGEGRTTEVAARATTLLQRLAEPFNRRLGWMPRTHPIVLDDGTVLVPLANENFNLAAMAFAHDGGARWTWSAPVPTLGVIQPSVVKLAGGRLAAFFRDARGTGQIARSDSADGGRTWSEAVPSGLPNPSGGIEALVLRSGALVVVYNDHTGRERDRLAISLSSDEGRTWTARRQLVHAPGERFDYPSIIQAREGALHVTFSDNLKTIRHMSFSEAWVRGGSAGSDAARD